MDCTTRVFIVDDHPLIRAGLASVINDQVGLTSCGDADEPAGAWELIQDALPDVIVVDLKLRRGNGLDLVKRIRRHRPWIRIVVSSAMDRHVYRDRCLRAGAHAYVEKSAPIEELLAAIGGLTSVIVPHDHPEPLVACHAGASEGYLDGSLTAQLTDRELEVFKLLGSGLSTRDIAKRLTRSVKTIESFRARIKRKLSLTSSAELIYEAVRWKVERESGNELAGSASAKAS